MSDTAARLVVLGVGILVLVVLLVLLNRSDRRRRAAALNDILDRIRTDPEFRSELGITDETAARMRAHVSEATPRDIDYDAIHAQSEADAAARRLHTSIGEIEAQASTLTSDQRARLAAALHAGNPTLRPN